MKSNWKSGIGVVGMGLVALVAVSELTLAEGAPLRISARHAIQQDESKSVEVLERQDSEQVVKDGWISRSGALQLSHKGKKAHSLRYAYSARLQKGDADYVLTVVDETAAVSTTFTFTVATGAMTVAQNGMPTVTALANPDNTVTVNGEVMEFADSIHLLAFGVDTMGVTGESWALVDEVVSNPDAFTSKGEASAPTRPFTRAVADAKP